MSNIIPDPIREDAFNLDGDAQSVLYEIQLSNNTFLYLSPRGQHIWQDRIYENIPCHMSTVSRQADTENSRPKFSVVNPGGIFTSAVYERHLEGARLTRHRLMTEDLAANRPLAISDSYRVSRVISVTKDLIVVECRKGLDGAAFQLPHRTFRPPEFPVVRTR